MEPRVTGLRERLKSGNVVITAEGYLMELERRGYNKNGSFIPTAILDHPERVEDLTREFVHAGSDVCSAFVYYATRNKLIDAGRTAEEFDILNRRAHEIAKKVAMETGTLFSAGLSKTAIYDPDDEATHELCAEQYREQMMLSAEYGVDFVHVETLWDYGEAAIALKVSKECGVPAVITFAPHGPGVIPQTFDGYELSDALQMLLDDGAACVGINCGRGPKTMIPIAKHLRAAIKGPLACVTIGYHTTPEEPTWHRLRNSETGEQSFPDDMAGHYIGTKEAEWYAEQMRDIGVDFIGFCCGNSGAYTRALAMKYGRAPPSTKYASDYGTQKEVAKGFTGKRFGEKLAKFLGVKQKS